LSSGLSAEKSNCGSSGHPAANGIAETSNPGGSSHNLGNANDSVNNYYFLGSTSNMANANTPADNNTNKNNNLVGPSSNMANVKTPASKKQLPGSVSNVANVKDPVKKKKNLADSSSKMGNAKKSAAAANATDTTGLKRPRPDSGEASASAGTSPADVDGYGDNSNRAVKKQRTVAGPSAASRTRATNLNPNPLDQELSASAQRTSNDYLPSQHSMAGVDKNSHVGENGVLERDVAQSNDEGTGDREEQEQVDPTDKMFTSEYYDPTEGKWSSNDEAEGPGGYGYTDDGHQQGELQQQPRANFDYTSFNNFIDEGGEWDHNYDYHHNYLLDNLEELEYRRGIEKENVDGIVNINDHSNFNSNSNGNPDANPDVNNYNIFDSIENPVNHVNYNYDHNGHNYPHVDEYNNDYAYSNDDSNDGGTIDPRKLVLSPGETLEAERGTAEALATAERVFWESIRRPNTLSSAAAATNWGSNNSNDDPYNGSSRQSAALLPAATERVARPIARSIEVQQRREQRDAKENYDDDDDDDDDEEEF
jgi:hypothetical protein